MRYRAAVLSVCMVSIAITTDGFGAGNKSVFGSEYVFPPHHLHNHSSSIVQSANGDLLLTWYRGSGERWADDVMIMGSRKRFGTETWEPPFVLVDVADYPDTNPILFIDPDQRLWLFWAQVLNNQWATVVLRYRTSDDYNDDGPPKWSWQDDVWMVMDERFVDDFCADAARLPTLIPADADTATQRKYAEYLERITRSREDIDDILYQRLGWMPRTHPFMVGDRLLIPVYGNFGSALMAYTEDRGETWSASRPIVGASPSQPAVVQRADGTLVAYMRDGSPLCRIQRSESPDGGITWTPAVPVDLPNPGSSVDVLRLANGHWVMVHNDVDHGHGRFRLAARVSTDEGVTWSTPRYLENTPETEGDPEKYCYPSILQSHDGLVHVTYSWRVKGVGECIKHAWFDEMWLTSDP